jgi:hypothetical protein
MIAVVKVICDDGGNVGGDDYGVSDNKLVVKIVLII